MKRAIIILTSLTILVFVGWKNGIFITAEQAGLSPESGATSRLKQTSDYLSTKGVGSDAEGSWGDWGTMWNRIYSTAEVSQDYSLQAHNDFDDYAGYSGDHSPITEDYQLEESSWTPINESAVPNMVMKDNRTGLYWSSDLGTSSNIFPDDHHAETCHFYNIVEYPDKGDYGGVDGTTDIDSACGSAINLCAASTVGGRSDWYLPSQKELMQAYIDGMYSQAGSGTGETKLTNAAAFTTANPYWSATEVSDLSAYAWRVYLNYGNTHFYYKSHTGYSVRCVARD